MRKLLCACLLLGGTTAASAEVTSKFDLEFYGFLKTDFIYADHGTSTNEYRIYTAAGRNDNSFRASARASRFGVNLATGVISGKAEADFLGLTDSLAGTAGTVADLRLRQAYVALKLGKAEFLAGQTFYPITADIPESLNDYYLGNSGALWSRAPQLRFTYSPVKTLKIITAAVRPSAKLTDAEGTHSALPCAQGKVEKSFGKARVSLAGAAGVWKSTSTQQTADVSLVVAAFNVPYSIFTAYGEAWTGRNLTDFLGGLGNTGYGPKGVRSRGGYLALKVKPNDNLWFNAMYGVDDPDNDNIAAKGRVRNATALVNAVLRLYDTVETGLEVAELATDYKGGPHRSSMNYQFTVKLPF